MISTLAILIVMVAFVSVLLASIIAIPIVDGRKRRRAEKKQQQEFTGMDGVIFFLKRNEIV